MHVTHPLVAWIWMSQLQVAERQQEHYYACEEPHWQTASAALGQ